MATIFLSYSRKDKAVMQKVKKALTKAGISVWTDEGIQTGEKSWKKAIEDNIEIAKGLVVIFSPDAKESQWVQEEMNYAESQKVPIFPLLTRGDSKNAVPFGYSASQWIDIRKDFDAGLDKLIKDFTKKGWVDKEGSAEPKTTTKAKPKSSKKEPTPQEALMEIIKQMPVWGWVVSGAVVLFAMFSTVNPSATGTETPDGVTDTPKVTNASGDEVTDTPDDTATDTPEVVLAIGSTATNQEDEADMVYVPAGLFEMGNDSGQSDEKPVHDVYLDAFWIYTYEVSNQLYWLCVDVDACAPPSGNDFDDEDYEDHPVVYVSWEDANDYCSWAGGRLPTEAEWEKAARGTQGRTYPWGEGINSNLANYKSDIGDTTVVGSYPDGKSIYGALDMAGNVWEWVNDWYSQSYYRSSPSDNPTGPNSANQRVLRGGSYASTENSMRSSIRLKDSPDAAEINYGFRCVVEP